MYRIFCFLIACVALVGIRVHAETTNGEIANNFAYCAAVGAAGKEAVTSPAGQKYFGSIYTKYLWDIFVFSAPEDAKDRYAEAVKRHASVAQETKSEDELSVKIIATLKNCDTMHAANAERINAYKLPKDENKGTAATIQPGSATPLELMAISGKPFHEDYNQDGRFVYNYESTVGTDTYLFDRKEKFIRMRSYCDSLKGKCSQ